MKKAGKNIAILIFWLCIWALIAFCIGSPVILANPLETAETFLHSLVTPTFWFAILTSFTHIAAGLIIACFLGCFLALLSSRFHFLRDVLSPALSFVKSSPVVCITILLLVWFGAAFVDLTTVLISVLPLYYFAIEQACKQRDVKRANMLLLYKVPFIRRVRIFEWPNIAPFFTQSTKVAVGISWKSGVTAELIGLGAASIGSNIYNDKLSLDTASILMWTIVVVLFCWACEKCVLSLVNFTSKKSRFRIEHGEIEDIKSEGSSLNISLENIYKAFNGNKLYDDFNLFIKPGQRVCITGETGSGKTTLVNMVLGLQRSCSGKVTLDSKNLDKTKRIFSVCFQEDLLLYNLTAAQNVSYIANVSEHSAIKFIKDILSEDAANLLPNELSGGMKRCVEICRAMAANSACVVLDEPFAGLDKETKLKAISFINRHIGKRTLILVSHDKDDASPNALNCELIYL